MPLLPLVTIRLCRQRSLRVQGLSSIQCAMTRKAALLVLALALTGLAQASVPVIPPSAPEAAPPSAPDGQTVAQRDAGFTPLSQILAAIRAQYTGHQLSVNGPYDGASGPVYEIKWLTAEGAVLYITVDAMSGAILAVEGG